LLFIQTEAKSKWVPDFAGTMGRIDIAR
jgi:hypothetical protein